MSDAALENRAIKRRWAEPGGRHDRLIKLMKVGLPILGLAVLVLLVLSPFDRRGDVSFILDKKDVSKANERMRIEQARYVGEDNRGRRFVISAARAVQPTSSEPVVRIQGIAARLEMDDGPLALAAERGRYDLDRKLIAVDGPIRVTGPDNYDLATRDVTVDLGRRQMESDGPVSGTMKLGAFSADRLSADLDQRTVRRDGNVRLKIEQGMGR